MTTAFMMYDLRRLLPTLGMTWAIVWGCVLLLPGPLQGGQPTIFQLLGILSGMILSARLMSDTGATQSYVFSRGATRRQVVLQRILSGQAVILALGASIWLLLVLGLRERLHTYLRWQDVLFYPMSTQFELSIIKPFLISSTSAFGLMTFYMTWRGLCNAAWNGTSSGVARLATLEVPVGILMLYVGLFSGGAVVIEGDQTDYVNLTNLLLWGPLYLAIVALGASWFAARDLEVV